MARAASRPHRKVPRIWTAIILSHSATGISSRFLYGSETPALATMTSRLPKRRTVSRTSRTTSSSTATSQGRPSTLPDRASPPTDASTDSLRSDATMTEAPSRRRAAAVARPIPRDPPVTMATFPFSPRSMRSHLYHTRSLSDYSDRLLASLRVLLDDPPGQGVEDRVFGGPPGGDVRAQHDRHSVRPQGGPGGGQPRRGGRDPDVRAGPTPPPGWAHHA